MQTLDNTSVQNEVAQGAKDQGARDQGFHVTASGRVFKPYHKDLLENIPAEIVEEMAHRELEKIETGKRNRQKD
jgi:hypothetical protein